VDFAAQRGVLPFDFLQHDLCVSSLHKKYSPAEPRWDSAAKSGNDECQ
jgi:hypothetical protein